MRAVCLLGMGLITGLWGWYGEAVELILGPAAISRFRMLTLPFCAFGDDKCYRFFGSRVFKPVLPISCLMQSEKSLKVNTSL